MLKFLLKSTNEVFLEDKMDVDAYRVEVENHAKENGYIISSWDEKLKTKKVDGDIEEFYVVKYTYVFNDNKNPVIPLSHISYNMEGEVWE